MTWLLSALTILAMYLAGRKTAWAWRVSLGNQCLWLWWIVASKNWGLLPMNLAMFFISGRNLYLWTRRPA